MTLQEGSNLLMFTFLLERHEQVENVRIVDRPNWGQVVRFTFDRQDVFIESWFFDGAETVFCTWNWSEEYSCHPFAEEFQLQQFRNWVREEIDQISE